MHWLDGLGGLLVMLAAMAAIVLFALPTFEGQCAFWYGALVLPFAAVGGGLVW